MIQKNLHIFLKEYRCFTLNFRDVKNVYRCEILISEPKGQCCNKYYIERLLIIY